MASSPIGEDGDACIEAWDCTARTNATRHDDNDATAANASPGGRLLVDGRVLQTAVKTPLLSMTGQPV